MASNISLAGANYLNIETFLTFLGLNFLNRSSSQITNGVYGSNDFKSLSGKTIIGYFFKCSYMILSISLMEFICRWDFSKFNSDGWVMIGTVSFKAV